MAIKCPACQAENPETKSFRADRGTQPSVASADQARFGAKNEALDWIENAVNRGFINDPFISKHDNFLDNIRGEECFKKLMERVKYEWEDFEE